MGAEDLKKEVDEMTDYFSRVDSIDLEPEETEEPESEVIDPELNTEPESDPEPEPEPEEPEPESSTEPVEDPLETIRRENAELKARLDELSKPKPEPEPEPTPLTIEEQNFLDGIDFDDVTADPATFNKLLNTLYTKAVTDTQTRLSESVLRSIPEIVRTNINTITNLKAASDKFYEDNSDLTPFKKVVATVFEEVAAENPDKELTELLSTVASESRKRLDLHNSVAKPTKPKPNTPSLPRKSGQPSRGTKPSTKGIESEISEMNKVLGV